MDINDVIDEANEGLATCGDCGEHMTEVESYHESGMCNRCRREAFEYACDQQYDAEKDEGGAA